MALAGTIRMILGLYFVWVRPPLLPEDPRSMGTSLAQIQASLPGLLIWIQRVSRVMGGHMFATCLLTLYVALTAFRRRARGVTGIVISAGMMDPGLVWYLAQTEHMTAQQFNQTVNHQSGLLGVSETSSDVRDLLRREGDDVRAAESVALFCYHVKKWIGAFAAALGGLDTLVFAGGIGVNAPVIRARICEGLDFLGVRFDANRNTAGEPVVSTDASGTHVRVIRTDEGVMIARAIFRILADPQTT